jgi:hypothetical protein
MLKYYQNNRLRNDKIRKKLINIFYPAVNSLCLGESGYIILRHSPMT